MADLTASKACALCGGPLDKHDLDRGTCHDCRSPDGKIADLDIAIRDSGDNPERLEDWPVIRHFLRKRFGEDRSDAELWERCTGWLHAEGRLGPNDYLPLPLNYLQWLLEHGFPRPEQLSAHRKLEALRTFQHELVGWNRSNPPSETRNGATNAPIGLPLLEAVVALQPFYRGALPKPALGLWRTFARVVPNDGKTAQDVARPLLEWLNGEIEAHRAGEQPVRNQAEARTADESSKPLAEGETPAAVVPAIPNGPPLDPNPANAKLRAGSAGEMNESEPAEASGNARTSTKRKRSTERGEGLAKLIAALTNHHKYADGSCLNLEPAGNNELARIADVSESTASAFFNKQFGGHTKYRTMCSDATRLIAALKLLNLEFAPHHLFGAKPPGEEVGEDEE